MYVQTCTNDTPEIKESLIYLLSISDSIFSTVSKPSHPGFGMADGRFGQRVCKFEAKFSSLMDEKKTFLGQDLSFRRKLASKTISLTKNKNNYLK